MTQYLEALLALKASGTMGAAALRLRVTPSAVSKRIAQLEQQLGYRVIEPRGRRVEITSSGLALISKLEPLLSEMKSILGGANRRSGGSPAHLTVGVTESVLSSWGAGLLIRAERRCPGVRLSIHAHRSPVVFERVRAGELALGICAGLGTVSGDATGASALGELRSEVLHREQMVIVPSGLRKVRLKTAVPFSIMTIESHSATWESIRRQLKQLEKQNGLVLHVSRELQSFSCLVQLARANFGHALVPIGVARSMGISRAKTMEFPKPGVVRPVSLVARTSTLSRETVQEFRAALILEAAKISASGAVSGHVFGHVSAVIDS